MLAQERVGGLRRLVAQVGTWHGLSTRRELITSAVMAYRIDVDRTDLPRVRELG